MYDSLWGQSAPAAVVAKEVWDTERVWSLISDGCHPSPPASHSTLHILRPARLIPCQISSVTRCTKPHSCPHTCCSAASWLLTRHHTFNLTRRAARSHFSLRRLEKPL